MDIELTKEDKRSLCAIAREAIEASLYHRQAIYPVPTAGCLQSAGAFVSLHENGELRGCIGHMRSDRQLSDTVEEMALAAAFEDPRFDPVSRSEIPDLEIEVTVLGPLKKITSVGEIAVGTHGLYISDRGRAGVLLPQVATEYGWDADEFLDHVCLKAGLPPGAWKDEGAQLFVFEGIVFGEKE